MSRYSAGFSELGNPCDPGYRVFVPYSDSECLGSWKVGRSVAMPPAASWVFLLYSSRLHKLKGNMKTQRASTNEVSVCININPDASLSQRRFLCSGKPCNIFWLFMIAEEFASMFKYFTLRKTKQPINVTGRFYRTDSGELLAGICFLSSVFTVQCQVTDKVGDTDAAPETCFRKVLQRSKQQYHQQTKLRYPDTLQ